MVMLELWSLFSLARAGASIYIQANNGYTALIWAFNNWHGSIVESLLKYYRLLYYNGVDPHILRRSLTPAGGTESLTAESLTAESLISLVPTSRSLDISRSYISSSMYNHTTC